MATKILGIKLEVDATQGAKLLGVFEKVEQNVNKTTEAQNRATAATQEQVRITIEQGQASDKLTKAIKSANALIEQGTKYQGLAWYNAERALNSYIGKVKELSTAQVALSNSQSRPNLGVNTEKKDNYTNYTTVADARKAADEAATLSAKRYADFVKEQSKLAADAEIEQLNRIRQAEALNYEARKRFYNEAFAKGGSLAERMGQSQPIPVQSSQVRGSIASGMSSAGAAASAANARAKELEIAASKKLAEQHAKEIASIEQLVNGKKSLISNVITATSVYKAFNLALSYTRQALLAIPKAGIEEQATKAATDAIFGTKQSAENLKFLRELADKAGQSILTLEQGYRKFAVSAMLAGATQKEVNTSFEQFTKVGTVLHLTADKMNSVFLALDQMYAKGTVQSEEIKKQLGNVLPGAVEIGAKAMGKSPAAFIDAMKKNEITAKEFVPKFAALYNQMISGAGDISFLNIAGQFNANLGRLENQYVLFNRSMFDRTQELMNTVLKGGVGILRGINENIGGILQAISVALGVYTAKIIYNTAATVAATIANTGYAASYTQISFAQGKVVQGAAAIAVYDGVFTKLAASMGRLFLPAAIVGGTVALTAYTASLAGLSGEYTKYKGVTEEGQVALQKTFAAQGAGADEAAAKLRRIAQIQENSNSILITYGNNQIQLSTIVAFAWEKLVSVFSTVKDKIVGFLDQVTAKLVERIATWTSRFAGFAAYINELVLAPSSSSMKLDSTSIWDRASAASKKAAEESKKSWGEVGQDLGSRLAEDISIGLKGLTSPTLDALAGKQKLRDFEKQMREPNIPAPKNDPIIEQELTSSKAKAAAEKQATLQKQILDKKLQELRYAANEEKAIIGHELDMNQAGYAAQLKSFGEYILSKADLQAQMILVEQKVIADEIALLEGSRKAVTSHAQEIKDAQTFLNDAAGKGELGGGFKADLSGLSPENLKAGIAEATATLAKYKDEVDGVSKADVRSQEIETQLAQLRSKQAELNRLSGKQALENTAEQIAQNKALLASINTINDAYFTSIGNSASALAAKQAQQQATPEHKNLVDASASGDVSAQNALTREALTFENEKLKANYEEAQKYRDGINAVRASYQELGATSSDVLTASLGGFAPLSNLFDNFMAKQENLLAKMKDLQAEAQYLSTIKIDPNSNTPEADNDALQKKIQTNAKEQMLLDKKISSNKMTTARDAFNTVGGLLKANSKEAKIAHVAALAFDVAEKFSTLSVLPVKAAEAQMEQAKGDPYTAFARMAAMAALCAAIIGAVGGNSGGAKVSSSGSMPESTGTGTTLGDSSKESNSLPNAITLLNDINFKSYRELVKLNDNFSGISNAIYNVALKNAKGQILAPSLGLPQLGSKVLTKGLNLPFDVTGAVMGGLFGKTKTSVTDGGVQTGKQLAGNILAGMDAIVQQYTTITETTKSWFKKSTKIYDIMQPATKIAVKSFTNLFDAVGKSVLDLASGLSSAAVTSVYLYKFPAIKISLQGKTSEQIITKMKAVISAQLDKMASAVFGKVFGDLQQLGEGMFETVNRLYAERAVAQTVFKKIGASFPTGIEEGVKFADALVQVSSNADTAAGKLKDFTQQLEDFYKNFSSAAQLNNDVVTGFAGQLATIFETGLTTDQVTKTSQYIKDTTKVQQDLIKASYKDTLNAIIAGSIKLPSIVGKTKILANVQGAEVAKVNSNINTPQLESFKTLKDIFNDSIAESGDLGKAIFAMFKATDESSTKARVAIMQLNNEYLKLSEDILKPIKDQIATIQDSIDPSTIDQLKAKLSSSKDYNEQKTLSAKIQKLILDKYNTEKTAITSIKNSFLQLGQLVKDLLLGDLSTLNPLQKLNEAKQQYNDLVALSHSTDASVAADAAGKLGNAAQNYLREAKSYYSATKEYAAIFNEVTTTLKGLSDSAQTTDEATVAAVKALGEAAIKDLNDLLAISSKALTTTLAENITNIMASDNVIAASDSLVTLASKASLLGETFDQVMIKLNKQLGTSPDAKTSSLQGLYNDLAKAIASKDKAGQTVIKNDIKAYTLGFKKGGSDQALVFLNAQQKRDEDISNINADTTLTDKQKKAKIAEVNKLAKGIVGFAKGGVTSGGQILVGEQGAELVTLPAGSKIHNNGNTQSLLANSNKETLNILTRMKDELIILNDRMESIERKTRLSKA